MQLFAHIALVGTCGVQLFRWVFEQTRDSHRQVSPIKGPLTLIALSEV